MLSHFFYNLSLCGTPSGKTTKASEKGHVQQICAINLQVSHELSTFAQTCTSSPVVLNRQQDYAMSITKTRQRLVEVARGLFARKGLEATTMNDIAVASQRGRRTLYTYFRNKEEIYYAVIESELERLSSEMDRVAALDIEPEQKILLLIYTHLRMIKETVTRNGTLRAEFFRNIWMVEKVRKTYDAEERHIIRAILQEGISQKKFQIENVGLMTDIIHYAAKGLEVPYIYDRLGIGLTEEESKPIVMEVIRRVLGEIK